MEEFGKKGKHSDLTQFGLKNLATVLWNQSRASLIEDTILMDEGVLVNNGALAVDTGEFTGRSPKDRFIVCDEKTENSVWWGDINLKFTSENFDKLFNRVADYLQEKDIYVRDTFACADERYKISIRVINELPWGNLFAHNMFLRPTDKEIEDFNPEWHIVCVPSFMAKPEIDHTRQHNFAILNFTRKIVLIGGTAYTGEIKKGIFSALNFILPHDENVLSMHCSANVGKEGDTAIFFGLSGTGKTTLSSDPSRKLIGDDEHGWSNDTVFNFEGGCYAKTIDLSAEKEPQIYDAIKFGALLENIGYIDEHSVPDYTDTTITQNTRVSYPLYHIDNIMEPSVGGEPKNIFFLTADAFGVLPPISKLTNAQAMYHFMSGYTAKVAGTEVGIVEPVSTFSACFGNVFMPLHPARYAEMLGKKLEGREINVWLVNTGWTGGGYGVGKRINLAYTRNIITAALEGKLNHVEYDTLPIFDLQFPTSCENVPSEILNPRNTWSEASKYDEEAHKLATKFVNNFKQFEAETSEEIINASPKVFAK